MTKMIKKMLQKGMTEQEIVTSIQSVLGMSTAYIKDTIKSIQEKG